ncbi:MAG TPA: hypothetical protein VJH24_05190 [Candidatus Bilamarchaeaceae archaeon]|nr:hypothetical protein [Candidatus Bilamarchaeaceae archaeon]
MAKFYRVKCKCGSEQNVFSHVTQAVACSTCKEILAQPSGGEAAILGEIVKELE